MMQGVNAPYNLCLDGLGKSFELTFSGGCEFDRVGHGCVLQTEFFLERREGLGALLFSLGKCGADIG